MSDYNTTVGVQLYDDFEKLKSDLPIIINQLNQLKQTLSHISSIKISSQGLKSISNQLGKISNFDMLNTQLENVNKTLNSLNVGNIREMKNELERLKQEYKSYLSTINKGTGNTVKSSNIYNRVKNSNFDSSGLNDIRGTKYQNITSYINNMNEGLKSVDRTAKETKKSITSMFSLGKAYWFINYTKQAFRGLGNIIQSALDFTETENYFSRAMGNMYDKAMTFQNKLTEMYGMSMNTMMNAQATYKNMISSLGGLSDNMSYRLSELVTKMTLDFSSLYNVDFDKTVQKMQSALSKQVRPIRSVSGYDITQNVLGATASDIGIKRSISDMNELEKRLLIILTLMNQMRNSGAMNDFSRTIEQPSNQLRILKEQLIEVGRWIGSVFYGTIGTVIPYVNGFVMAMKELIKTFALFVGYQIPDSSGETGTILDQLSDSTDDINSGLGTAGANTDKAIKKAKEWKNVLMSFDVADVIPTQSTTDSSGSGGSGAGGMTVDPKILDALGKYNYIFDNVHMKAQDIRDMLLEWEKIARRTITNELFKPMQYSWEKYGKSILQNMKNGFYDIRDIGIDAIDVISVKWRPFFQSASNMFFSFMDTGSLAFSTVTGIAKDAWDTGGKVFLEGVFDLITATLKLATAINDEFIKPTVRLFKNTLGVVFSKTIGAMLNLLGQMMSFLAKLVTLISRNSTVVRVLTTSFAAFFSIVKIGKITSLLNGFSSTASALDKFMIIMAGSSKTGNRFVSMIENSRMKTDLLKSSFEYGVNSISKFFMRMRDSVSMTKLYQIGVGTATASTGALGTAQTITAKATVLLQNALNFLAAHPLVAVAMAIGTAVVALGAFASAQSKAEMSIEDCSQEIQDQYNEFKNLEDAIDSAKESAEDQIAQTEAQIRVAENYISQLRKMTDDKGYVTNVDEAKRLITEINKVIPDTVRLTKEGRIEWQKTPSEINKATEAMKKQAKQQAYQEMYVELIKNQIKQEQKLKEVYEKKKELEKQQIKELNKYNSTHQNATMTLEEYKDIHTKVNDELKEQNTLYKKEKESLNKTNKEVSKLEDNMSNLNDESKKTSKNNQEVKETTDDMSDSMSNAAKEAGKSGSNAGKNYSTSMNSAIKSGYEIIKRTLGFNSSNATEMLKKYPITYSTNVQSIDGKVENAKKTNSVLGTLKNALIYSTNVQDLTSKAKKAKETAQKSIGTLGILAKVTGDFKKAGENAGSNFKKGFSKNSQMKISGGALGALGQLKFYASGGFPDVGQLFIARENGIPEMVGKMGSKNAVANNSQIENGIYRAVLQAMRDSGNSRMVGGDLHITIKNNDGTSVEKIIKDYNKLMQQTGGKGGFNV